MSCRMNNGFCGCPEGVCLDNGGVQYQKRREPLPLMPDHPHFRPQPGEQWYARIPGWKTREISTAEILSATDKTVLMKLIMGDIAGAHWRYLISEVEWIERITKAGEGE